MDETDLRLLLIIRRVTVKWETDKACFLQIKTWKWYQKAKKICSGNPKFFWSFIYNPFEPVSISWHYSFKYGPEPSLHSAWASVQYSNFLCRTHILLGKIYQLCNNYFNSYNALVVKIQIKVFFWPWAKARAGSQCWNLSNAPAPSQKCCLLVATAPATQHWIKTYSSKLSAVRDDLLGLRMSDPELKADDFLYSANLLTFVILRI